MMELTCAKCKGKVDETRPYWRKRYESGKHVPLCGECWSKVYAGATRRDGRPRRGDSGCYQEGNADGSWDNAIGRYEGEP